MVRLLIIATLITSNQAVFAQHKTFISGPLQSGFYVGPETKICLALGQLEIFTGGRAGWIINHKFVIGAAAYAMVSDRSIIYWPPDGDFMGARLKMNYGASCSSISTTPTSSSISPWI